MTQLTYKGFHACKNEGGYNHIVQNIPFKSGNGKDQWLTEGYYFWTDSDYWAKQWRKRKMKSSQKVIGEFDIKLCHETELLDLVGNVKHQFYLRDLKRELMNTLTKDEQGEITVHQIISYFRQRELVFPFSAIKAQDGQCMEELRFVDPEFGYDETMQLVTRQQMCVFEKAKDKITLTGFSHPSEYTDQYNAEL